MPVNGNLESFNEFQHLYWPRQVEDFFSLSCFSVRITEDVLRLLDAGR